MNRLEDYRNKLKEIFLKANTLAFAYHPDADGMGATKILVDYFIENNIDKKNLHFFPVNKNNRILEPEQVEKIHGLSPDMVIYLDLCIHEDSGGYNLDDQLKRLREKVKYILSIDHHHFKEDLPGKFDLYINSKYFDELTAPQVHTASKLLNTIFYNTKHDWLEILSLEGDMAVPSMLGTLSYEATHILNLLGTIERDDESIQEEAKRRNNLLNCLLSSNNLKDFLENFNKLDLLPSLYKKITDDINWNVEKLKTLEPSLKFRGHSIYIYPIRAQKGFEIIGQILKEHFPFLGDNSTYIIHQELQTKGTYQIFQYSSSPLVDCYKIATDRGGGGHTNRSGFALYEGSLEKTLSDVVETIKKMIEEGEKDYAS